MKILTRYLFREVLAQFRLFLSMFIVILLVNITYDKFGEILKNAPPLFTVIEFFAVSLPGAMAMALPLICLLSTIFSYGLLAKNKEILAMVASGVSFFRLAMPALIFGFGMTVFMFWFNESVVPAANSRASYLEKIKFQENKKQAVFTKNKDLLVRGMNNRFYYMEQYDPESRVMSYPTIFKISADGRAIDERIEAERIELDPQKPGADTKVNYGTVYNAERWRFAPDGSVASYEKPSQPFKIKFEENLDLFLSKAKKPTEMNFSELRAYISNMKGISQDLSVSEVELQRKLSFPLSCLLMALLGFAVVADVHARRFARGVTTGLLIAVLYYVLDGFMKGMVQRKLMAAMVAAWFPLMIFTIIVLVLTSRLKKIRL